MKRKALLSILLVVTMFIFTACGSSNKDNKENKEEVVDNTSFIVNNLEFHLDREATYSGINYKISKEFKEAVHNMYIQYNYLQEDSSNLLFFRIFYYENQDVNYAINDLGLEGNIEFTEGKTDNIEYKLYVEPRDDGGTIHFYFVNKDNNLYVLSFISKYDIKDFEEKVLNTIKF